MSKAKKLTIKTKKPPKITLLYMLLIPMFISVILSLFAGDYQGFTLRIIGFVILYAGIELTKKGFTAKEIYSSSKLAKAPKIPYLLLGATGLSIATFSIRFFIGGKPILESIFVAIVCMVGFYLYYGFDPKDDKTAQIDGISVDFVLSSIKEAQDKLEDILSEMNHIDDKLLKTKLNLAIKKAQSIIETIKDDPKDIRVARKFMVVYIDGIGKVVSSYTQLGDENITNRSKEKLYGLLDSVQSRFDSQLKSLKENNQFDLDVSIETLKEQIKN